MNIFCKSTLPSIIITLSILIIACSKSGFESETPPNIIIIYADDVGVGDIGVYGSELIPTPHIDQLAADGIRFTSAYATAATCTPSRYSLLTGEYAFRNERAQILTGEAPLLIEPGSFTMPEMLRRAGYRTSVVGKWHLGLGEGDVDWNGKIGPGPLEVGFDESFLLPATNDRVPTVYVKGHYVEGLSDDDDPLRVRYSEQIGNLPTGHSHPELLRYPADNQHSGTIVGGVSRIGWQDGGQSAWWDDEQMAFEFTERSQEFIERQKDGPFFLFLSMHEPHVPRIPHPQFVGESQTGLRGDVIVELDWVVGQIVKTLEEQGIRDETLVIFTSDNGPVFFDGYYEDSVETAGEHRPSGPFRGGKYQTLEGGTRMPFIASWPAGIDRGLIFDGIFSQVDLMATFASLVDVDLPDGEAPDSQSLLPLLLGSSDHGREFVVQQGAELAIRKGKWKYIPDGQVASRAQHKHSMGPTSLSTGELDPIPYLFNLDQDIGETTNVAEDYPEIVNELAELLEQIRNQPERSLLNLTSE